jgi:site-specific recombinase XerD
MESSTEVMLSTIERFLEYLKIERMASKVTLRDYYRELFRLNDFLLSKDIVDINLISTRILREYIYRSKESRNLASSSTSKLIAIIKSFFNYLEEDEVIAKNPTRKIKVPPKINKIPTVMSKHEVDNIIRSVDYTPLRYRKNTVRDRLILTLLYYTGIRRSELLKLNWDDLNLSKSTLVIRSGKGNKDRLIPIHPTLSDLLDKYLEERLPLIDNALIIGEKGRRMCKCCFVDILNRYLEISGLKKKGYSAHSFRHSFASHLIESGVDLFKVQSLLGHASLETTKVYINFNSTQMAKAVERL